MAETKRNTQKTSQLEAEYSPSRRALKNFFSCRYHHHREAEEKRKKCKRIGCTGSVCHLKDTSGVMQRPEAEVTKRRASISGCKAPLREINGVVSKSLSSHSSSTLTASSSSSSVGGSFRVMHLRRLSGCYECHMVIDPINGVLRDSSMRHFVESLGCITSPLVYN